MGYSAYWAPSLFQDSYIDKNNPDNSSNITQLRATTNVHVKNVCVITWDDLGKFTIGGLADKFAQQAPLAFYLTETMVAPWKKGIVIVRTK